MCWANAITVLQEVAMTPAAREKACEPPSELSYFGEFGPSQWSWDTLTATLQWRCRPRWAPFAIKAALQLPPDVGIVDALATACKQMGVTCQRAATHCQPSPTASWGEMIGCTVATTATCRCDGCFGTDQCNSRFSRGQNCYDSSAAAPSAAAPAVAASSNNRSAPYGLRKCPR